MISLSLLGSRRFGPMFTTMALSAFNDNFYKNALIIITTYSLAAEMGMEAATLLSIAALAFILPFFLFSGIAGEIADHFPKHVIVRLLKVTEFVLMILAGIALVFQHSWSLMGLLFLIGVQAAFFGPVKYAILPELLRRDELLVGNAMIESGTFFSILLGTLIGGLLILMPQGTMIVAIAMIIAAFAGLYAAYKVPETKVSAHGLTIRYNIFKSTWEMVNHAIRNPNLRYPILGISWFWAIGVTYLTQIPVFTKDIIGADEKVVTLFNGVFTVGIALGSFYCPMIIRWMGARAKHLSTIALAGIFVFGVDVCFIGYRSAPVVSNELLGLVEYLSASSHHIRLAVDLFMLAFCGGMFCVPLYTQLQTTSAEHVRARSIASNNVMNALFIASASALAAVMFGLDFSVLHVLFVFALLNIPVIMVLFYSSRNKPA